MTRLLVLMGSGETAPTMVKPHRATFERLGAGPVPAVVLDTPYGFQENAADISAKAVEYFRSSVGRAVEVAGLPRTDGPDAVAREAALARIAAARWVFAGPGSPTYALRQWRGTDVPALLADKLAAGGCVVFASAAALTLGAWTVPVYEIYKVGAEVEWLAGLDVLAPLGLPVAVIPHYNNAEGGGHDTRFCYLGERRLRLLEAQLPPGAWVLGVDEHTACVLDLDARTAAVVGNGVVTVRRQGRSATVAAGECVAMDALAGLAEGKGATGSAVPAAVPEAADAPFVAASADATPLLGDIRRLEADFAGAVQRRDVDGAVRAILDLDAVLVAWGTDTNVSDDHDRGHAALRRMVVRLGHLAATGARDPKEVVGPFVDALLAERAGARTDRRFADADRIRDVLTAVGVEVRDTAGATEWIFTGA
ncbi:MAG TPA: hypothetical protein VG184_00520 [Acidimicrobiales bacterium]|jgi:cyanophycinase-like exopeptidase|nr:hypothetical protein [Acidimicrobiales bacterium]